LSSFKLINHQYTIFVVVSKEQKSVGSARKKIKNETATLKTAKKEMRPYFSYFDTLLVSSQPHTKNESQSRRSIGPFLQKPPATS
jgi:hypothetical protein